MSKNKYYKYRVNAVAGYLYVKADNQDEADERAEYAGMNDTEDAIFWPECDGQDYTVTYVGRAENDEE